ncbi:MAG: signal peptidase [Thermoleophilaceae bacterium]|jgi:signal peptidase II|nr:signal peptidase [Thermoleophilaceae bacterium]
MSRRGAWLRAAAAAAVLLALDQATKQIVVHSLARGESRNVFFGIELTNVRNKGVAFGAFGGGGVPVTLLTVIAVGLLIGYFALHATRPWLWLPVGVIAGGAFGNLLDRVREGAVVDFIDPMLWPAFNIADTGIVLGILGLLYVIEGPRKKAAE